ncbi:MAG TPA: carboxymuconolactone decarboxylase family protein [Balneolaceae bacterium]|nr:carboxymuconolactone decarboxylase family protein [Balneolaceae bacterium]
MSDRINLRKLAPDAYKIMYNFEQYLAQSSLTDRHKELIKIRASQINGCAYCLDMHTKDARNAGESEQRLYLLSAWRETSLFTNEEKAILALTEEMTKIQNGVSEATYNRALQLLGKEYLAEVMMAVIIINAWNRIGVSTSLPLPD